MSLPTDRGDIIGLDRAVFPHTGQALAPNANLGQLENKAVNRVLGEDALGVAKKGYALGRIGGAVELVHDGVEGLRTIVEIIILAGINADVLGLGVRDDGEVEIVATENLLQPLGPFDGDNLKLDADAGKAFIVERLADGASMLSSLYWAAYVESKPTKKQLSDYVRYNDIDSDAKLKGPQ